MGANKTAVPEGAEPGARQGNRSLDPNDARRKGKRKDSIRSHSDPDLPSSPRSTSQAPDGEKGPGHSRVLVKRGGIKASEPAPTRERSDSVSSNHTHGFRETAKRFLPGRLGSGIDPGKNMTASQKLAINAVSVTDVAPAPGNLLLEKTPAELTNEILFLRSENEELKKRAARLSVQATDIVLLQSNTSPDEYSTSDLQSRIDIELQKHLPNLPPRPGDTTDDRQISVTVSAWNKSQVQIKELSDAVQELECAFQPLEDELRDTRAKLAEEGRRVKATLKELALSTRTESSIYDDNHFRDAVIKLRYDIRSWARNQAWIPASIPRHGGSSKVLRPYTFMKSTCEEFNEYVVSEGGMAWLVEAHIWQYLLAQVFGRFIWCDRKGFYFPGGTNGRTVNDVAKWWDKLEDEHAGETLPNELLQAWRVATSRLYAVSPASDPAIAIKLRVDDLSRDFDHKHLVDAPIDIQTLNEIFREATKLDMLLSQQTAEYIFLPKKEKASSVQFNINSMDVENEQDLEAIPEVLRAVKLVIAPSFRKYGNSAGRNYQDGFSLCKTVVHVSKRN